VVYFVLGFGTTVVESLVFLFFSEDLQVRTSTHLSATARALAPLQAAARATAAASFARNSALTGRGRLLPRMSGVRTRRAWHFWPLYFPRSLSALPFRAPFPRSLSRRPTQQASNSLCGFSVLVTVAFEIPIFRHSDKVGACLLQHAWWD
jgi:hypothetical protein